MRQMDSGRPAPKRVVVKRAPSRPPVTDVQSSGGYAPRKAPAHTKSTAPSPRHSQVIAYVARAKPKTSRADIGPGSGYVRPPRHTTVVTPELYSLLAKIHHIDINPNHLPLGQALDHEWETKAITIPIARIRNTPYVPGFRGKLPAFPPTSRQFKN